MYKRRDAGSPTPGDSATSGFNICGNSTVICTVWPSAPDATTRAWTPCPGTAPVYLQTVFCTVWTKTPVVATRQARQPCPGTALRVSRQCSALSGPRHLSLPHDKHANLVMELHLCISRQCSALSGPKHLSLQHDGHAKIVQELHCVSPDSVLHCLDQNTCSCNTTGMPKLSRNCNCKPPKLFCTVWTKTPMLHQYGHVNNHAQELHLRNVRRKPGTCRCITTGRTNLSRNCNRGISKQYSHCLGHNVSLHNGHDNILVQKTALRTVRRKPGTCRCSTTGTSTSLPKNCNCRNSTE